MPTLSIVACAAPLAARAPDLLTAAHQAGWTATLTATTAATHTWLPDTPTAPTLRHPDAVVVCPLTFNSANKLAAGINDTPLLGHLNQALTTCPVLAVPMLKHELWDHPTWQRTLHQLHTAGITLLDPSTGTPPPAPVNSGTSETITAAFDPAWIITALNQTT